MRTGKSYRSCQRRVGAGPESRTGAQRDRSAELHSALPRESRWKPAASRRSNFFVLRRGRVLAALAGLLLLAAPAGQAQFSFSTNAGIITLTQYYGYDSSVTIPDFVNIVGDGAFFYDYSWRLTNVTIPNSVTTIGDDAFNYCWSLTSVTIPNSVTTIGDGAFSECFRLTSVTIPNSVINIGDYAFDSCSNLTSVTIPNSVTSIADLTFAYCTSLTNLTIPNSVTSIGGWAFEGCTSLTNVTIPNSVTNVGDSAFWRCTSLTNVTIPNSVTSIGNAAFLGCSSLRSVTIPNSVTSIGDSAFGGCSSLRRVTIPNSVTNIGGGAFGGCSSLTNIAVDVANPAYASLGGVLFNNALSTLIVYPGGLAGNYVIPNSVTNFGDEAFYGCSGLTNVTIPDSVTNVGDGAFYGCSGLTNVTIPNSVTSIGGWAFAACSSLRSVTIPNSVTNIGDYAYEGCSSLVSVYFQGNAPSADCNVFYYDPVTVYYLPGTTGWGTTFACVPTAPWTLPYPLVLNSASGFGVQSHGFGFTISWATNLSVVVEAATNLANPVWTPLATNPLVNGTNCFSDPYWTNYPGRFYRIVSQ